MQRHVALDTETTSRYAQYAGLIELCAIEFDPRSAKVGRFIERRFNPGRSIPAEVTKLTGITNEMARSAPRFTRTDAMDLVDFVRGAVVWIHNASYDQIVVNRHLGWFALPNIQSIATVRCSMQLARQIGCRPASLDAVCDQLGISRTARHLHGARMDSELVAQIVRRIGAMNQRFVLTHLAKTHEAETGRANVQLSLYPEEERAYRASPSAALVSRSERAEDEFPIPRFRASA